MKRTLGTCYYPEHWPEAQWAEDAARMAELGLTWVRIGEFAWSRLEPSPGDLQFDWLDRAIETLGGAGLKVVLGTPTATPPRWMLDRHPDMLAVDADGRPRGFGSRRHYCFSHDGYREESARITRLLADRYGRNPHVAAWQTDNEYGCHDTVISYSDAARAAFRDWCKDRYGTIEALNAAWGNVFWSMEYQGFDQIGLPNLTVTEPNPAHGLAFRRFSSDQVARFNAVQVDIIRARSEAPISHNYMGRITDFDHYDTGRQMEIATWDSYPMGFLEDRIEADDAYKRRYARQGDPDFQAFHHDLYRAVGNGRWWVMEQQPGPVNRKPRAKKAPSKEKLISKLKYLERDDKLQLVSVNPLDIIDAKEVWVYNIKTRKLGKYVAADHATLQVKGAGLQFYDEKLSIQKTLRKPDETLKEFKKAGKVQLRKFMDNIKTTDIKLNGRLNSDTIILKCVQ